MKTKHKSLEESDPGFDSKQFWRHYVATVDTDQEWNDERPQPGRGSNRLFLFLLLFHVFLITSVVLFNLVAERPKPVFVDNSAPPKAVAKTDGKATSSAPVAAPAAPQFVEYRVASGESLKSIADTTGVPQEEIAKLNEIDVNMQLAVGSVLRVPKSKSKPATIPTGLQPSRVPEKVLAVKATIDPVATEMFAAVTPAPAPKKVESTTSSKLPVIAIKPPEDKPKTKVEDRPPASKPKVEESTAAAQKATEAKALVRNEPSAAPKKSEAAKPTGTTTAKMAVASSHTVKSNETFYSISRKYGVNVNELMKVNGVTDPGRLREGVVLKLPK